MLQEATPPTFGEVVGILQERNDFLDNRPADLVEATIANGTLIEEDGTIGSIELANEEDDERDALQYAEAVQTRIVTTEIDPDDGERDDASADIRAVTEHIVETHTAIDERIADLERRMDRAERDIDLVDGGL